VDTELIELLREIARVLSRYGVKAYAVGGVVRDWLLGKQRTDIDIAVPESGKKWGRLLKKELGGKLETYSEYENAVWYCRGIRIDLVGLRKERYPYPGALPVVSPGRLEEDLARRDFTINAMAMELTPTGEFKLIDMFGGQQDLKLGLIRVLHPKSFMDDPTRIFRAARFAARLGFQIEPLTARWAHETVTTGILRKISPARIKHEFQLLLSEPTRVDALRILNKLTVLEALNLKLRPALLNRCVSIYQRYKEGEEWLLYYLTLIPFDKPPIYFPEPTRREAKILNEVDEFLKSLRPKFVRLRKPSHIYFMLQGFEIESLLYLLGATQLRRIGDYLDKYRFVKLTIDGYTLQKMGVKPSPLLGTILRRVLAAKLDGKLHTKQDELQFARSLLKRLST